MLNKCKPPKGSFKHVKKGYEEIHIPVPKQNPTDDAGLVLISSLLEWVEQTLPGAKKLNRAQGKQYLTTHGTDEPLLLCASTGAGKVFSFPFITSLVG